METSEAVTRASRRNVIAAIGAAPLMAQARSIDLVSGWRVLSRIARTGLD